MIVLFIVCAVTMTYGTANGKHVGDASYMWVLGQIYAYSIYIYIVWISGRPRQKWKQKNVKDVQPVLSMRGSLTAHKTKCCPLSMFILWRIYRKIASCQKYDIQPINQIAVDGTGTSLALIYTPLHLPFTLTPPPG